jgi:glycosyltransferase involved in cell wall biosynthesis
MKIVMTILRFKPAIGGGEEHVYQLSKGLIKRGHQVVIYTSDLETHYPNPSYLDTKVAEEREYNGVPVKHFHALCLSRKYPILRGFIRNLLKEEVDIIHAHGFGYFPCDIASLICRIRNIPLVVTTHGFFPSSTPMSRLLVAVYIGFAKIGLLRQANKIICVSNSDKNYYARLIDPDKIVVIPNGIDIDYWSTLPKRGFFRIKYNLKGPVIGSIGRIVWAKGFQYLIRAAPEILAKFPNAKIVIAGRDCGYLPELKKLAYKLGVHKSIIFTGPLKSEEVKGFYVDSDVIVIPSIHEPFGIVALEAMACGKAIVASRVGGLSDIIVHGKNGLLIEPGNVKQLSEALISVLADEKLARSLGEEGTLIIKQYSWDRIVRETEKIYFEVIRQTNS